MISTVDMTCSAAARDCAALTNFLTEHLLEPILNDIDGIVAEARKVCEEGTMKVDQRKLLNILLEHGETVLQVAQQGSVQSRAQTQSTRGRTKIDEYVRNNAEIQFDSIVEIYEKFGGNQAEHDLNIWGDVHGDYLHGVAMQARFWSFDWMRMSAFIGL